MQSFSIDIPSTEDSGHTCMTHDEILWKWCIFVITVYTHVLRKYKQMNYDISHKIQI
jgi:hypothetical protein